MDIHVGNLPNPTQDQELMALFTPYGQVTSAVVDNPGSPRNPSTGRVTMPNPQEGNTAIRRLDGSTYKGKVLEVHQIR